MTEKLRRIDRQDRENGLVTKAIASFAKKELGVSPISSEDADIYRAREALKHFVRDWSAEGQTERERTHLPVLEALCKAVPERTTRANKTVLLPGAGMGRLAWEVSELGKKDKYFREPN